MKKQTLLAAMTEVVQFVQQAIDGGNSDHWTLCRLTADRFKLWGRSDGDEHFPIWLSRVIEGELRDKGIE